MRIIKTIQPLSFNQYELYQLEFLGFKGRINEVLNMEFQLFKHHTQKGDVWSVDIGEENRSLFLKKKTCVVKYRFSWI